jgi:hypothetical protein
MHRRKGKVLEAYTVSLDGSEMHRVVRGSGILKHHSDKPNEFARFAYHEGDLFFRGYYTAKRLSMVWLITNKDKLLRWRDGSEEFWIDNERIWWGRDRKGEVRLKKLDGEFDLKKVDPDRVKLWEGKYAECIRAFYDRYDVVLKNAGFTWAKLEIEFVRRGRPFPDA